MNIKIVLAEILEKKELIEASFTKVKLRPIILKSGFFYQLTRQEKSQALHQNITPEKVLDLITEELLPPSKQAFFFTVHADYHLLQNKQGGFKILKKPPTKSLKPLTHN